MDFGAGVMCKICVGLTLPIIVVLVVVIWTHFPTKTYENGSALKSGFYYEACTENITWCTVYIGAVRQTVKHSAYSIAYAINSADASKMPRAEWEGFAETVKKASLGCLPDDTSNGELANIWIEYLRTHTDMHEKPAPITLFSAIMDAYSCE